MEPVQNENWTGEWLTDLGDIVTVYNRQIIKHNGIPVEDPTFINGDGHTIFGLLVHKRRFEDGAERKI